MWLVVGSCADGNCVDGGVEGMVSFVVSADDQ